MHLSQLWCKYHFNRVTDSYSFNLSALTKFGKEYPKCHEHLGTYES